MAKKRVDSLFLRLLMAQLALVVCSILVFAVLLIIERNQLIAPQLAQMWAPRIMRALEMPPISPTLVLADGDVIWRGANLPNGFKLRIRSMPAVEDFTRELARQGVWIDDVWMTFTGGHLRLWLRLKAPQGQYVWLGGNVPGELLPQWAPRMTVGIILLALAIALVSRAIARGVTQPLALLRQRMLEHAQTGEVAVPASGLGGRAPPELLAIDASYRQLAERLQRNERERALLLAGVSHDLRSPLTRIRLAAEMLPETRANAAGVAAITRNVDLADRLTASFLEFVRASAVALDETVDLAVATRSAVGSFERPIHELHLQSVSSLLLHDAHRVLIEQLIRNLIDNALKHGGTPVSVHLSSDSDMAVLTVSDTGPGLPPDSAGRLMEAFARGDPSRQVPGFGLGLAIAQRVVMRLQGTISFSKDGPLHQVTVRLPLHRR
jgi:two-component system osmolarity sensor histidine kinase EnvZ